MASELQPADAEAHNPLGTAFSKKGRVNEAIIPKRRQTLLHILL